uniref:Uncharacterized protein n=1 Tax=Kalanchoe fedtschenkoi TaxID=63787 RepID=A0A7N0U8N9_KALFE
MTVFGSAAGHGGFLTPKQQQQQQQQVYPILDYEKEVSQMLVDAALDNDHELACQCLRDPFVEVNFIGAVSLTTRKSEVVLHDESAHEVRMEYEVFKTEATALFLAAHAGNLPLVRRLLSAGADVNQKLFRGYATTAAVREGNVGILKMLVDGGASQPACEEALMEASHFDQAKAARMLMESEMIRPSVAVHALVTACCKGFADVVAALIQCGVDVNATDRALLQSSKPSLFANIDCNALVAAVVSRQTCIVRLLLEAGVRKDMKVRVGAWSWDKTTGEEFRVGAGLGDPYDIAWCAVEYFEASGTILRMLLPSKPIQHSGPTLIHHAVVCGNVDALHVLVSCGLDAQLPVKTGPENGVRPIHLASRLGSSKAVQCLINAGCDLNSRTVTEDTALMICVRNKREECLRLLASAGADFGLTNSSGESAGSIAGSMGWNAVFQRVVLRAIKAGKPMTSSNHAVLAPLVLVTRTGDTEALRSLIDMPDVDLNQQDESGLTAAMVAGIEGQEAALTLLVHAGASLQLTNRAGHTAMILSKLHHNGRMFDKVVRHFEQEMRDRCPASMHPLHRAALNGDADFVHFLSSSGYDVNVPDSDGNTPLMLAAKQGHGRVCQVLISHGAKCDTKNRKGETALSLARMGNGAAAVIMDELGKMHVLSGAQVKKHTKGGKGSPHRKELKMLAGTGILRWGKNRRRNVICKDAQVGPSDDFRWNRRKKFDTEEPGLFHVVTTKNKTLHFVCEGGNQEAELWVRGIKAVTSDEIMFGNKN